MTTTAQGVEAQIEAVIRRARTIIPYYEPQAVTVSRAVHEALKAERKTERKIDTWSVGRLPLTVASYLDGALVVVRLEGDRTHSAEIKLPDPLAPPAVISRTVARLLSEIARPRPMVAILEDLDGCQLAEGENPHTGQRVYAMSRPLFMRLEHGMAVGRAQFVSNYAEVSSHPGRTLEVAILPPSGSRAALLSMPPEDMPEPHTLRLEPKPIEGE